MAVLLATLILVHLLMAATSLPLIAGRVPPNRTYGFRTPKTLSNERVWYAANAVLGRWMLGATAVSAVFSVVYMSLNHGLLAPVVPLVFLTFALLVAVVASLVTLKRIAP